MITPSSGELRLIDWNGILRGLIHARAARRRWDLHALTRAMPYGEEVGGGD